ncbi:nitroreductase family protein [Saliphagus sp. GCM10025334]
MSVENQERYVAPERYDQLLEVLQSRRAVRGYKDKPVEDEKIDQLLEAARWAPSGANSQPWEFVVVTDPDTIRAIGDIYVEYYDDQYAEGDPDFPVDNKRWMCEVPLYIIPIGDRRIPDKAYPQIEGEEQLNEEIFQHSIANAIYAIWLAATSLGLSTTSASCFSHHKEEIRALLDIPNIYDMPATLPIGYPLKYQETRYRHPVEDLVHRGSYDRSRFREEDELLKDIDQVRRSRYRGDGKLIPKEELFNDENGE